MKPRVSISYIDPLTNEKKTILVKAKNRVKAVYKWIRENPDKKMLPVCCLDPKTQKP